MSQNGDLSLEEKLILESQINQKKFLVILFQRSFSRYLFAFALVIISFFLLIYSGIYHITIGFLTFLTSGILLIIAGGVGTLGTSESLNKLAALFGGGKSSETSKERKSREDKAVGSTLVYSLAGTFMFITSYFFI